MINLAQNEIGNDTYCDVDWVTYSNSKCFKVLNKKAEKLKGIDLCNELDSNSTLITIESDEEQDFLYKLFVENIDISPNVWIGLELKPNETSDEVNMIIKDNVTEGEGSVYGWFNGKTIIYNNWDENADKDKQCVYMSSSGKWRDDSCGKKYLIVCQKSQWTLKSLSKEIHYLKKGC